MIHRTGLFVLASISVLALAVCGGGSSSPTGGGTVVTPPPTTAPPATPPPVTNTTCPLGKGTADTTCYKASAAFSQQIEEAIDLLARQKPQIFDLNDNRGNGSYLVKDVNAYYEGVIANLQAAGMCAGFDYQYFNVKNSNDFSDQYDILLADNHVRRGAATYQGSCFPANFPVDPHEVIASIKISFFGYSCDPGIKPPPFADHKLPIGCQGFLTATPKDRDGNDVDERIHGDSITWLLEDGKGVVDTHHVDGQPFNWTLQPLRLGGFSFCATLQGVHSCFNGQVIENPQ